MVVIGVVIVLAGVIYLLHQNEKVSQELGVSEKLLAMYNVCLYSRLHIT